MQEPILITGAARSGASMIAGILHLCGVYSGEAVDNPMFENRGIKNSVIRPYLLNNCGVDPNGQFPLPEIDNLSIPITLRKKVENLISDQGYTNGKWMVKDPTLCLAYPAWAYAFPNARWVVVRRKDDDIVDSCMNTGYMTAFKDKNAVAAVGAITERDAWYWWVRQHNKRFVGMIEDGLNCKQIHPERMVNGDYSQIYELLEWLGLKWNSDIPMYIEPKIWKTRIKSTAL